MGDSDSEILDIGDIAKKIDKRSISSKQNAKKAREEKLKKKKEKYDELEDSDTEIVIKSVKKDPPKKKEEIDENKIIEIYKNLREEEKKNKKPKDKNLESDKKVENVGQQKSSDNFIRLNILRDNIIKKAN